MLKSAGEVQGFVCALGRSIHRVQHLPGTTNVAPGTNRQRRGRQPQRMDGENPIDPGYDLGGGPEYYGREVYLFHVMLMSECG